MPSFSAAAEADSPKQMAGKEKSREGKCPAKAETVEGLAKKTQSKAPASMSFLAPSPPAAGRVR
jgi:hypothetical protein